MTHQPGTLVRVRNRDWIVQPSSDPDLLMLKPLGGAESETVGIYLPLGFKEDQVKPAVFPKPLVEDLGSYAQGRLLFDAARLSFRDVAGPFRSLGKLSFRPRAYQMVPLIMALKQAPDPIRLLIADDVGIGKTIEALLIVKELLERKEIQRFAVVCLPHLCEQWQAELREKFSIEAVIIRSNTQARLDREVPGDISVYQYYPYQILSIDYIKSDQRRKGFVHECPELIIVDEAHTCTRPSGGSKNQQQRYRLIKEISEKSQQNLVLLTATPHSGKPVQFQSLLGLLQPEFEHQDLAAAGPKERQVIARHFVQRRRGDVTQWIKEDTPFPFRDAGEFQYNLSQAYSQCYNEALEFSQGLMEKSTNKQGQKKFQYWTLLALLRGIMSSPAAGMEMLNKRIERAEESREEEAEEELSNPLIESDYGLESDVSPQHLLDKVDWDEQQRRTLRKLHKRLEGLQTLVHDQKLAACKKIIQDWLKEGFQPIIFCKYIATAHYLGKQLVTQLPKQVNIQVVTSEDPDEVRRERIEAMGNSARRVLIATDCLSEGINLQDLFDAVLHYDLPWNPNRLEQREGRVDRFGQKAEEVKAYLLYSPDNPIDGTVLKVLLRKVREIRKSIGISIPFPEDSETLMDAVLQAVLLKPLEVRNHLQLQLDFGADNPIQAKEIQATKAIEAVAEREKRSHSLFAQHSIKAAQIEQDLAEADQAIGDPGAVEQFVLGALGSLGVQMEPQQEGYKLFCSNLPGSLRETLPSESQLAVSFHSPVSPGYHYLGRNHLFVEQLCQQLLAQAFEHEGGRGQGRAAVIRSTAVTTRTTLVLFRVRNVIESKSGKKRQLVAEEMLAWGYTGAVSDPNTLSPEAVIQLLAEARPAEALSPQAQSQRLQRELDQLDRLQAPFEELALQRAEALVAAHERFRQAMGGHAYQVVKPVLPMDIMGIYILLPVA